MLRAARLLLAPGLAQLATASLLAAAAEAAPTVRATASARADTVTIPLDTGLPWVDPQHRSPLEVLASTIATRIAERPVTIRCEGDNDWAKLTRERNVDANAGLGYVGVTVYTSGGIVVQVDTESFAELSPGTCLALQAFGQADPKPTTCAPTVPVTQTVQRAKRVTTKVKVDLGPDPKRPGKRRTVVRSVTRTVPVPVQVTTQQPGPPVPCYTGGVDPAQRSPAFAVPATREYLTAYASTAAALLTLAHEALHLGGLVGGTTSTGVAYGDPQAEAKAQCGGLQWIAWVAQQFGAGSADAVAIAQFETRWHYPPLRTGLPLYWSAECVPGGAMDVRAAGGGNAAAPWPTGLG